MKTQIAIIDAGFGNVGSVFNMCRRVTSKSLVVTGDTAVLEEAQKLILPGVGHFSNAAAQIDRLGLRSLMNDLVIGKKTPILGICIGMQLLGSGSEEGDGRGFGWIDGTCVKFDAARLGGRKIPHMGWNYVTATNIDSPLNRFGEMKPRFYHVHSYHMQAAPEQVIMSTDYGYPYASGVQKGNVYGVQFHPEKSHVYGMNLLRSFCDAD